MTPDRPAWISLILSPGIGIHSPTEYLYVVPAWSMPHNSSGSAKVSFLNATEWRTACWPKNDKTYNLTNRCYFVNSRAGNLDFINYSVYLGSLASVYKSRHSLVMSVS